METPSSWADCIKNNRPIRLDDTADPSHVLETMRDTLLELSDMCHVARMLWIMGIVSQEAPVPVSSHLAGVINAVDIRQLPTALGTTWGCCTAASQACVARILRTTPVSRPFPFPAIKEATTRAPVRIDLAGGWTDTPPIALEADGAVVNAAILIDGACPICAKAELRVSETPHIIMTERTWSGTVIRRVDSLAMFTDIRPSQPMAIVKAALLVSGVIRADDDADLTTQIRASLPDPYNTLWVTSECCLPTGTGLGVSSIVASALLDAIARSRGTPYTSDVALVRDVLSLEQVIGCGGGWQDQIGGVIGGVKLTQWGAGLRDDPFITTLRGVGTRSVLKDMCLIYTGGQRISAKAVRTTVDGWHRRDDMITRTVSQLRHGAQEMATALQSGDAAAVGTALSRYWELKKNMVGVEAEPATFSATMATIEARLHGWSLAGAGGGGYAVAVMRDDETIDSVKAGMRATDPDALVVAFTCTDDGLLRE